jgi:hypothetical protein
MAYQLTPPTVDETPGGFVRLIWRYLIARGDSILVNGTVVTRLRTPGVDQVAEADYAYIGGHVYFISDAERTILINAGYSANITTV